MKEEKIKVEVTGEFIKLDSLLKFAGVTETGGVAKDVIQSGKVKYNGEVCYMRGKKVYKGDLVSIDEIGLTIEVAGS